MEPGDDVSEGGARREEPAKGAPAAQQPGEEPRIIVVDDMPEVRAEEPVFGGMRERDGRGLEEAYHDVVAALRRLYDERYRNPSPADSRQLFSELDSEVFLVRAEAVGRIIALMHGNGSCSPEEEETLLRAAAEFLDSVK